jgi:hypothetical protein
MDQVVCGGLWWSVVVYGGDGLVTTSSPLLHHLPRDLHFSWPPVLQGGASPPTGLQATMTTSPCDSRYLDSLESSIDSVYGLLSPVGFKKGRVNTTDTRPSRRQRLPCVWLCACIRSYIEWKFYRLLSVTSLPQRRLQVVMLCRSQITLACCISLFPSTPTTSDRMTYLQFRVITTDWSIFKI